MIRKDETRDNRLLLGGNFKDASIPTRPGIYSQVKRIYNNNIHYLSGLILLKAWYTTVRPLFMSSGLSAILLTHLNDNLDVCFIERIKRFKDLGSKLINSKNMLLLDNTPLGSPVVESHNSALENIDPAIEILEKEFASDFSKTEQAVAFLELLVTCVENNTHEAYINTIQSINPKTKFAGSIWLESIHNNILTHCII